MRKIIAGIAIVSSLSFASRSTSLTFASPPVKVYKDPSCECCVKWIALLRKAGFTVSVDESSDLKTPKTQLKVPSSLRSCHTAVAGDYVFEGHVPIDLISKVLAERPPFSGLAVRGMPVGSPGMEMPGRKDIYDVMTFGAHGQSVYAKR